MERQATKTVQPSAVGDVVDVARHTWWKAAPLAIMWLTFGIPCLMTAAVIVYIASTESTEWFFGFIAILPFLFGWMGLTSAIYWLRTAFQTGYHFRAGPGGLSVRVPGGTTRFGLGLEIFDFEVNWQQVKRCYPYLRTINGITSESAIVVEGDSGWEAHIHTAHFAESRDTIADNIAQAAQLGQRQSA